MLDQMSSDDELLCDERPGQQVPVPVFCLRYQSEKMERSKPLRIVAVSGATVCAGRPFELSEDEPCRVLLYCKNPALSMWADAVVTKPPAPFETNSRFHGVRLLSQGKFQLQDYIEAVARAFFNFLQSFEQYSHFTLDDCAVLARLAGTRELQRGEVLYTVGEHSPDENDLYLVTAGSMKAYKRDPKDPADNIAGIGTGEFLGENTFVLEQPHTASITALVDAWLIQFSRSGLRYLECTHPQIFIKMYKLIAETLVRRLARTTARWKKYDR